MTHQMTLPALGTLGNIAGVQSDGVHVGVITPIAPSKMILGRTSLASPLCITDDGGSYADETTPFNESTGDDVEVLPATPAAEDAAYFGVAGKTFDKIDLDITTQGAGTWTITWEYWDGSAFSALAGVTDGTTGFTAATGTVSVTFTLPTDWEENTVDGVEAYWVRARVSAYTSVTTAPQLGQGWILNTTTLQFTNDTTDFGDAGAGDVELMTTYPVVGDASYFGHTEKFCKLKVTTSQAAVLTATNQWQYWNGIAWTAIPTATIEDDTAGWVTTAGALIVHFVPPSDWVANTAANGPGGDTGFFIRLALTAYTSLTTQPLASIGTVLPMVTGAVGFPSPVGGTATKIRGNSVTNSGSNADSIFLLLNATQGTWEALTWTKADSFEQWTGTLDLDPQDEILIIQITEDGTTEFADVVFYVYIA